MGWYQVRDITTNNEWEQAYQYEIPVLAILQEDNSEVMMYCQSLVFSTIVFLVFCCYLETYYEGRILRWHRY